MVDINQCQILSKIYCVVGIIGSFVLAAVYGKSATIYYYEVVYERNWGLTIAILVGALFSVVLITVALYTLGEIHAKVCSLEEKMILVNNKLSSIQTSPANEKTSS